VGQRDAFRVPFFRQSVDVFLRIVCTWRQYTWYNLVCAGQKDVCVSPIENGPGNLSLCPG
jgi:hypothetical protein